MDVAGAKWELSKLEGEDQRSSSEPDSDDEFEDASNEHLEPVDLSQSFTDCETAMTLFFNNDVRGAKHLIQPYAGSSVYHSLGGAIFLFIPAILTFDDTRISEASAAIKHCINICKRNKKQRGFVETLGSIIKKTNYGLYTDLEAHAELCYAEALLLQAVLTVAEGEDLTGYFKSTLKVRTCYQIYKHCTEMLEKKKWESEESRKHFHSGVQLGTAAFNLIISMLPPRFVSVLEFVGYGANRQSKARDSLDEQICIRRKKLGLHELQKGSNTPGLRRVLCDLTLLLYHSVLLSFVGEEGDHDLCKMIVEKALQEYPDSVWFLVFKARSEFLQGRLDSAIAEYMNTSRICQRGLEEFRHVCYWELMWISALKLDFRSSSGYAAKLIDLSSWSRTTNMYIKASMLMQLGNKATQSDYIEVRKLLKEAEGHKMRISGKSLPMEKFVIKRCARYHIQKEKLILPYLELLCIWNLLPTLGVEHQPILQQMLKSIKETREVALYGSRAWMCGYSGDNAALLRYMQGCVLSALKVPRQALLQLEQVVIMKKDIKEDHFLVPYSVLEMAVCYSQLGDNDKSKELLMEAKKKYSGYALEARLQFRVHARLQMIREMDMQK